MTTNPTTPHRLVVIPEHRRRGRRVKQHIRRLPQKTLVAPPYMAPQTPGTESDGPGYSNVGGIDSSSSVVSW